jgi:7-carboxy-7-deazaguanine synthase
LTGGEPFIQPLADLEVLVNNLVHLQGLTVECFSNGSIKYPNWALRDIDFMMDWKLAGSGEQGFHREERSLNALKLKANDGIKFVVVDQADLEEAVQVWDGLAAEGCIADFWVGAAWERISDQEVIEFVKAHKLPWRLNVQVHKYVWEPNKRGV